MNHLNNCLTRVGSLFSRKKEVCVTFDALEYSAAVQALKKAKISYNVKLTYMGHGNQLGGRISSFGENIAKQTEYQIYVQSKDYEYAVYVIHQKPQKESALASNT